MVIPRSVAPEAVNSSSSDLEECIEKYHQSLQQKPVNNLHETIEDVVKWRSHLPKKHREVFDNIIVPKYLEKHGQERVYGIILAGEAKIQSVAPQLYEMLQNDMSKNYTKDIRQLVISLGGLQYKPAYETIEKFVDTELSLVAVHSLARINFKRSALYINDAMAGKYAEWRELNMEGRIQRLALLFTDIMCDAGQSVGPKAVLQVLEQNKSKLNVDPMIVKEAFAQALDLYRNSDGNRYVHDKRAFYYIKQVPRILTGRQGAPVQN